MAIERLASTHLSSPRPIDHGLAGIPTHSAHDRRTASRNRRWTRASRRERRLGNYLDRRLGLFAVVLHDRALPSNRGRIDHLVVAATGVWIISAAHQNGRVRRGQTDVNVDLESSASEVRSTLEAIGFDWVDVHPVICFTNGDWRPLAKPFRSNGTWISRPKALTTQIGAPGALAPLDLPTVAGELSSKLPCAAG